MSRAESTRPVFLLGFMGAGKTSVGRALARRLGWTFLDLDEVVEGQQGKSVAAIFAEAGEAEFRRMESAALQELLDQDEGQGENAGKGLIVALGGGAFVQTHNRNALERAGAITILLEAPLEELLRRCEQHSQARPLARDARVFAQLFAERRRAYELARFRVDTMHKNVEEVATELESLVTAAAKPEVKK